MKVTLAFEITLDSDYHVGSGHGDSLIDSILLHDGDDLPDIRSPTAAGILRAGAWRSPNYGPRARARKGARSALRGRPD